MKDFYGTLGVAKDATLGEIKKAFRRRSAKNHPDKGGDAKTMSEINRAYMVLRDPRKRDAYDKGESTAEPLTLKQEAQICLCSIFAIAVDKFVEEGIDLTQKVREVIERGLSSAPTNMTNLKAKVKKIEKAKTKLKRINNAPNIFEVILDEKLLGAQRMVAQCEKDILMGPIMLEMLDNYSWEDLELDRYLLPQTVWTAW